MDEGAEFDNLVADSLAYMHRAIEDCNREWDFQGYRQWSVSLDWRVLTFYDGPRPPIDCDIQVAGIFMTNRNMWRWGWDNPSIEPALRTELERVRAFGQEHGIEEITLGGWEAEDEEAAWAMTALAANLLGARSVYRAPSDLESGLACVLDVVENVRVLDNDLRSAAVVTVEREGGHEVVYLPGFQGPFLPR